mgnify:CR=1 FL=1
MEEDTKGIIDRNNPHVYCSSDHFNASMYLMAIGIGYLFPFSALTQPVDYWNYLFPGENMGKQTIL